MKCKNCGAEMHEGDTFCGECGIKIESQEKEAIQCSECGKFFNKDFGICPFCGTELAEDNIKTIDNQNTLLSATDTEEPFVREDTEDNFVLCPNCNNTYDINVGLCAICGYSATELGGAPNKQEEDDSICPDCGEQIDKEFGLCFSCGYSVKKSKVNREKNENKEHIEKELTTNQAQVASSDKLQNAYSSTYADTTDNKPVNYKNIGIIAAVVICVVIVLFVILSSPKRTGVSQNTLENNIKSSYEVINGVAENEFVNDSAYKLIDIIIDERYTAPEENTDRIYCHAIIENDYFRSELNYELLYNYYSGEGWKLDYKVMTESSTVPLKAIEKDMIESVNVEANGYKTKLDNSNISEIEFDEDNMISKVYYKYTDDKVTFEGYNTYVFINASWHFDNNKEFSTISIMPNWNSTKCYESKSEHEYSDTWLYCKPGATPVYTDFYIVEESQKQDKYKYYYVNEPEFNYTFLVTKVDTKSGKISGSLTLEGANKSSLTPDLENTVKIEFCEDLNLSTGNFTIDETIGMCCYHKDGWLSKPEDVHFVKMKIQIDVSYSISRQEWYLKFKVIEKAENDNRILCDSVEYTKNTK